MEKKVGAEIEELPKTIVRRVVKEKLSQCSRNQDISVNKDSLLAFCESARIFIHYLSATSNDICKESKRQTIKAEDVLKALEDMEFPELVRPLKASLNEFRSKNAGKKAAASRIKEAKKRKIEEEPTVEGTDGESKDDVENDNDDNDDGNDKDEDEDEVENGGSDD
ncbi:DNA polymerase epsilon subunit 3 [Cucurbita moschata]|uniref:DNA polymerase epsilon subunit 3 n=1 Tax=Cucurbita moschata TaxID=3662 RepID=A0A6J1H495_CUCMO|nr:DNA polymerase epsilon subunit 3 [Cucurbita moschata]XP_022958710.1 DNA polymerase epsilon subunit 3 [Cucurbita moschata]